MCWRRGTHHQRHTRGRRQHMAFPSAWYNLTFWDPRDRVGGRPPAPGWRAHLWLQTISLSSTNVSSHLRSKSSTEERGALDFASWWPKFFQETFNHQGIIFPQTSVSILVTGGAYCFCMLRFPLGKYAHSLKFLLMFQTRWVEDPLCSSTGRAAWLGRWHILGSRGRQMPCRSQAVANVFQRVANGLANQCDSNGCSCLRYKYGWAMCSKFPHLPGWLKGHMHV